MYIGGMSSSLPEDVQYEMYHSVPGLENAKIVRNAYAIEYDCIDARQLYPTLEFKILRDCSPADSLTEAQDTRRRQPRTGSRYQCSHGSLRP